MVTTAEIDKVFRALVSRVFPILNGPICPYKGRVISVYDGGRKADVQVLDSTGNPISSWPVLPKLPVPRNQTAQPGKLVRLGFYYADPSQPYIDEVLE